MSASDPISEKVRWALMRRLIEVLGEEEAETLMESLPPVVWSQLATKDDLAALEERLRAEMNGQFALLRGEFVGQKGEFALQLARMTRTMVLTFISVSVAMLGAFTAIVYTAPV
ncbi:MAG: hypothetical protein OXF99_07800 [bacterium]|nr:hypothetical protein [bacterium]